MPLRCSILDIFSRYFCKQSPGGILVKMFIFWHMLVPYGYQNCSLYPGFLHHNLDLNLSCFIPEMMASVPAVMFLEAKTASSIGLNTENRVKTWVGCADTLMWDSLLLHIYSIRLFSIIIWGGWGEVLYRVLWLYQGLKLLELTKPNLSSPRLNGEKKWKSTLRRSRVKEPVSTD